MISPSPTGSARRSLHWFRTDLRLHDNPGLMASAGAQEIMTVFIDETDASLRPRGGAARWWLHHSLEQLQRSIAAQGGELLLLRGNARHLIPDLAQRLGCDLVTWNRRYGMAERSLDSEIKSELKQQGIQAESFNAHLLYEPMEIKTQLGGPMRVFTPFWKACRAKRNPAAPIPAPGSLSKARVSLDCLDHLSLNALNLCPTQPDWAGGLRQAWQPGEAGAMEKLNAFLAGPLDGYADNRDRPDFTSTSLLSPHLAFGEISPRQIWQITEHRAEAGEISASRGDIDKFFAEIGWREFAYHLLFHYPTIGSANYQPKFDHFPWEDNPAGLLAWQQGQTGYPMVDAGMRQLWQTGFMHNRVRMIVASFLIKHLMLDWRHGEAWFWDTLCDADPASNAASWQWVAGSGADAAPYYRIFNPFTQGEKFDPEGIYVRQFIPELAGLPNAFIHRPWEAPPHILARAGVRLDETYPRPIVSHTMARERALAAFQALSA